MKNIWKIFTGDLKKLVKQPFALVIIIGLCVIPSLYAWFNIFANWDPYANTGGIPVAVVSLDKCKMDLSGYRGRSKRGRGSRKILCSRRHYR